MRLLALLAALPLLAACAGGGATAAEGRIVELRLNDFSYAPKDLALRAGETVTLKLVNDGKVEHEFMAGTSATPSKGFAKDLLHDVDIRTKGADKHGKDGHTGKGVRVAAGKTAAMTFTVPASLGSYEFACFIAGHYEAGMKGVLKIDQ
ncbi:MAG TPA: plastocyanin/azurin family copper-binding protein [Candidatus Limnocylindria bacterium]|nr:plastocyanin/azurin family copper-binding protein [Candidatus Limnocylindria bacterium]